MEIHQESKGLPRTESWAFLKECQQEKTPEKKKGVEPLWMVVTWRPSLKSRPRSQIRREQGMATSGHCRREVFSKSSTVFEESLTRRDAAQ